MSKIDEILEKLRDSEISCMTDKRNEARADRLNQAKLAILEVVRGCLGEKKLTYEHREINGMKEVDGRYNAGYNDKIDDINSKVGGL